MGLNHHRAIRLVAYFEAFKGLLVLVTAVGLLNYAHQDLHALAARLIRHFHLNPAAEYPQLFLDGASAIQGPRLLVLAAGALSYVLIRFFEAYGLFRGRSWAEVLAAASGAIYLPIEIYEFWQQTSRLLVAMIIINAAIVALMLYALYRRRRLDSAPRS